MRRLSPQEAALWRAVAGSVRPLPKPPQNGEVARAKRVTEGPVSNDKPLVGLTPAPPPFPSSRERSPSPFQGGSAANTLDARWDKQLATGRIEPDFTIDLHGETLSSAHARLNRSLDFAIRTGARVILLITGRPAADNPRLPPTSRGVIRASVKDWLAASSHTSRIAAIRNAHPRHGGAGALYLILRRIRD